MYINKKTMAPHFKEIRFKMKMVQVFGHSSV